MRAYFRFELRRLARDPRLMLFAVVTPVISYVVFSGVAQSDDPVLNRQVATALMVGLACYGAVFGALGVGVSVSLERTNGWLRQLRATPLQPARVIVVRAALSTLPAMPAVVAVGLAGWIQHGITLPAERWALLLGVLWVGTIPFALLGLAIGYGLSPQVAQPVSFLSFFALAVLGGLLVPVTVLPVLLRKLANGLPTYRYAELGWRATDGLWPSGGGVAILAGWGVLFAALAAYAYRRFAAVR